MARLTGCCCCFDNLRDGARAIGIVHLVLGSLAIIGQFVLIGFEVQNENVSTGEIVGIALQFLFSILYIVFNSLLVHGLEKKHHGMLLAWLIFSGIWHGLQSLAVVICFVIACIYGVVVLVLLVLAFAGLVGVFWYWFVVVLHCLLTMREENGFVYGKQQNEGEPERHAL